jgi:hypothetical protein
VHRRVVRELDIARRAVPRARSRLPPRAATDVVGRRVETVEYRGTGAATAFTQLDRGRSARLFRVA